ncbi:MAG TPA: (Fe-S)-binding protein [Stenotrophobium sp.]|nr:(Fe-S)-binding protein [Stenotrophobium sp.]
MPTSTAPFPLADADLCVKCGLCLPHCPTYQLTRHEGDSPRGRIMLMQGLATGMIAQNATLEAHLDGCLSCRACEAVCPANVPYGRLIDAGHALLAPQRPQHSRSARRIGFWLAHRRARRSVGVLLWLYQRSGLQWLLRRTRLLGKSRLARLESLLPSLAWPRALHTTPDTGSRPRIMLFTGCTGELADRRTLEDTVRVLQHLGVGVDVPRNQACCGALHQHAGLTTDATRFARINLQAFGDGDRRILSCASGCGATLKDYPDIAGPDAAPFSLRIEDIGAYLLANWPAGLQLRPLAARVLLHTPCTLRNVMKTSGSVQMLLRKIPQLEIAELDRSAACCGAAGSTFITQPETADALLQPKLDAVRAQPPDFIVSSNIGCALHLAGGLRRAGLKVPVLHPVSLLARQLP